MASESRTSKLAEKMREAGVDCFFAQDPITMDYLHGFGEHSHERFLTLAIHADGRVALICPALSENQARRSGIGDVRSWKDGENPYALFRSLADEWRLEAGIGAVDDALPSMFLLGMQDALPAALFKPGGPILAQLMRTKSIEEIESMERAGNFVDRAFESLLGKLRTGMTERGIERLLRDLVAEHGGDPTFCGVCIGPASAEPHHINDDTPLIPGQVLLVDFGCEWKGYQADITRTLAWGDVDTEVHRVYDAVFAAHMAARDAARPGVTGAEVDAAARKVLECAGYGEAFVHRTGHGIGRRVHEAPNMSADNHESISEGDCFSIEPGAYFAGRFGVRIENIVTCTATGCRSLNVEPAAHLLILPS